MSARDFHPTRWLLCSPSACQAIIEDPGCRAAGGPLMNLRLDSAHVRCVRPDDVETLLAQLGTGSPGGQVRLVVDDADAVDIHALRRLAGLGIELRVHYWREQSLEVLASLDAPDDAIVDTWRAVLLREPAAATLRPAAALDSAWVERLRVALQQWSRLARAEHGDEAFDALYPPRLFDWNEFESTRSAGDATLRYGHRRLPLLSFQVVDGQPRLEGLLMQAPLEHLDSQVLHLHGPAANEPHLAADRVRMRGAAPRRRIEIEGSAHGAACTLVLTLPEQARLELHVECRMAWELAFGVGALEIGVHDAAGAPATPLLRIGPPLPWQAEDALHRFEVHLPCPQELWHRLAGVDAVRLWLRRIPASAPD